MLSYMLCCATCYVELHVMMSYMLCCATCYVELHVMLCYMLWKLPLSILRLFSLSLSFLPSHLINYHNNFTKFHFQLLLSRHKVYMFYKVIQCGFPCSELNMNLMRHNITQRTANHESLCLFTACASRTQCYILIGTKHSDT